MTLQCGSANNATRINETCGWHMWQILLAPLKPGWLPKTESGRCNTFAPTVGFRLPLQYATHLAAWLMWEELTSIATSTAVTDELWSIMSEGVAITEPSGRSSACWAMFLPPSLLLWLLPSPDPPPPPKVDRQDHWGLPWEREKHAYCTFLGKDTSEWWSFRLLCFLYRPYLTTLLLSRMVWVQWILFRWCISSLFTLQS